MSVVLITNHDENIYNSTKKATTYHKKSPRYVSKFRGAIKAEADARNRKKNFATMGLPRLPLPSPTDFLRKKPKEGRRKIVGAKAAAEADAEPQKEKPARARKKNFISINIKKVINLKPREHEPRLVMNQFGATKELSAGLEPVHIYNSTFGKMPDYLTKFIKTKEKDLQLLKDSSATKQPKCRYVTREQREILLAGLKENWEELQKKYQGLPILTDTIPKMHRKSKLEADLKQLEKDIVLLERHPYIYVYDDSELTR